MSRQQSDGSLSRRSARRNHPSGRSRIRCATVSGGVVMRRTFTISSVAGLAITVGVLAGVTGNEAAASSAMHRASGVGSCTLKNWNPSSDPEDAKSRPEGDRPQTYKPDDYDCTGAKFAANGSEFARFPQAHDFS